MLDPDLSRYVTLPDDLDAPAAGQIAERPARILLTGATGYLGAYLLAALSERSAATIVCLVRADNDVGGLARLKANLARYELHADFSRVELVIGSVEQPHLGLSEATWAKLAADIDTIIDAAADVNFMSPLSQLLAINVGGPLNLLRLAGDTRPKALHLSSSYSVFNEASYTGVTDVREEPLVGDGSGFRGGYPASKWIAERIGDLARERGWNVTAYRLGYLWGDTRTGRSKPSDPLVLNVRACLAMGKAQDLDLLMHITPVDFAAAAMAEIALAPVHANGHYNVLPETPITWRDFVQGIRACGHPIEFTPFKAWHDALRGLLQTHREFTALVLGSSFDPERSASTNITRMRFDASRLRGALASSGVACPHLDQALIATYVDAMASENALRPSQVPA
jgi:thioester reductase-like protein